MHVDQITARDVKRAIKLAMGVVDRRSPIPAFRALTLRAEAGQLAVAAGAPGCDVACRIAMPAAVRAPGEAHVNAKAFGEMFKGTSPGDDVTLRVDDDALRIVAGERAASLPLVPDVVPHKFDEVQPPAFRLPAHALADALRVTAWAVPDDPIRYYLQGVYMHADDGFLRFVATNGHVLAQAVCPAPDGMPEKFGHILDSRGTATLAVALRGEVEPVGVSLPRTPDILRYVTFGAGSVAVAVRSVDGSYPDYRRVVPREDSLPGHVAFDPRVMRQVLSGVPKDAPARLAIGPSGIEVSATRDGATMRAVVPCSPENPEGVVIGFNPGYLRSALDMWPHGDVTIRYRGPGDPVLLHGDLPGWSCGMSAVVMPMRLSQPEA